MKAHLRHARISPKKANLVAAMVRRCTVNDALDMLEKLPKKGAVILHSLIASAIANAEHNANQKRSSLFIKSIIVNKGPAFRRAIPMARGRSRPIDKFTSHLSVELGIVVPKSETAKASKAEAKSPKKEKSVKSKSKSKVKKEKKERVAPEGAVVEYSATKPTESFQKAKGKKSSDDNAGEVKPTEDHGSSTFQPHHKGGRGS